MEAAPLVSCLDGPSTKHSPLSSYVNSMGNYDEYDFLPLHGYGPHQRSTSSCSPWLLARGSRVLFGLRPPHRLRILLVGPYSGRCATSRAAQQPPHGRDSLGGRPGTGRTLSGSSPLPGIDPHALRACPRRAASFGLRQWSCYPSPWCEQSSSLRPYHSRATSDGQAQCPADNHGVSYSTDELPSQALAA